MDNVSAQYRGSIDSRILQVAQRSKSVGPDKSFPSTTDLGILPQRKMDMNLFDLQAYQLLILLLRYNKRLYNMSGILSETGPLANIDHLRGRKILGKFCGEFVGMGTDFILHPSHSARI